MTPTGRLLAVGVVAGAAGDPSLEDVGEREEELLDPLLDDPAGGGAGEDGESAGCRGRMSRSFAGITTAFLTVIS